MKWRILTAVIFLTGGVMNCSLEQSLQGSVWEMTEAKYVVSGTLRTYAYPLTSYDSCIASGGTATVCDACANSSCPRDTISTVALYFSDSETRLLTAVQKTCYKTTACEESPAIAGYSTYSLAEKRYLVMNLGGGQISGAVALDGETATLTRTVVSDPLTGAKVDETYKIKKKVN